MCYCLWLGSGICPPRTIPLGPKTTMDYIGITDKMREEAIQNLEDNATKSIKPLWKKDDKKIAQLFGFNNR